MSVASEAEFTYDNSVGTCPQGSAHVLARDEGFEGYLWLFDDVAYSDEDGRSIVVKVGKFGSHEDAVKETSDWLFDHYDGGEDPLPSIVRYSSGSTGEALTSNRPNSNIKR